MSIHIVTKQGVRVFLREEEIKSFIPDTEGTIIEAFGGRRYVVPNHLSHNLPKHKSIHSMLDKETRSPVWNERQT